MFGLNIDPMNSHGNPTGAQLKSLGVKTVRWTYEDGLPGDKLDSSRLNFYMARLQDYQSQGIKSLIILSYETYPNKPSFTDSDELWFKYIDLYMIRVRQLSQMLAIYNPAYQIWNEPDLAPQPGYEPSLREFIYGTMLWRAREIIKVYSGKDTPVIGAGLASGDPSWWKRVVNSVPGKPLIDGNAIHPYGQRPEPDWPDPNWGFGYFGDLLRRYQEVFDGHWWVSEIGVKDCTDEFQAEYMRRMYNRIITKYSQMGLHNPNGGVDQVSWFCYSDGMVDEYGLVREDSSRKPAYYTYENIANV